MGSDAIDCAKEHKTLIDSPNFLSHNPASTKKQKTSTSHYRTAVTGASAAKVCNGCRLNAHNQKHHNCGNFQRCTHPEFNREENVTYANSTAGSITRRAAVGLPELPYIEKTCRTPNNKVPAAGYVEAAEGMVRATEVLLHVPPV